MAEYKVFLHRSTETSGNSTFINDTFTGRPDDMLIVTPNWNPPGTRGLYLNHAIGVRFDSQSNRWAIFNQDRASMPSGAAFNVAAFRASAVTTFVHRASHENTEGAYTSLNHPLINGQPDVVLTITANWNPLGAGGVYNDHIIGVSYDRIGKMWTIFNEDLMPIPTGASFNVHLSRGLAHYAFPMNSRGHYTSLEIPEIESRPHAIVITTHNFIPGNALNSHSSGVWYDGRRWSIFNQNLAAIASDFLSTGNVFNVEAWGSPGIYQEDLSVLPHHVDPEVVWE